MALTGATVYVINIRQILFCTEGRGEAVTAIWYKPDDVRNLLAKYAMIYNERAHPLERIPSAIDVPKDKQHNMTYLAHHVRENPAFLFRLMADTFGSYLIEYEFFSKRSYGVYTSLIVDACDDLTGIFNIVVADDKRTISESNVRFNWSDFGDALVEQTITHRLCLFNEPIKRTIA